MNLQIAETLKIAWVSPWNGQSAIATFGCAVIEELLALGHHVEVIRSEAGAALDLPPRPSPVPVLNASEMTKTILVETYDAVVVNLGNHFPFHGGALPMMREQPAHVLILHDAWMGDFISGWREAAGADAFRIHAWQDTFADDPSGLSALCPMAYCAVVHAEHYRAAAEQATSGRVAQFPLAFVNDPTAEWTPPTSGRLKVATVGHAIPNKRIAETIRAISVSVRLRNDTRYTVIGPIDVDEEAALTAIAAHSGFAQGLSFTGYATDAELRNHIAGTDVICCLRNPLTEGGSASVILAMQSGRPVIVSDHGCYAEIPDGLVLKCPPGAEAASIARHLEWILDEPEKARTMAVAARAYAYRMHHPARYARDLLDVIDDAISVAPLVLAERAIGGILGQIGVRAGDPAVRLVAESMSMFDTGR